jgi:hypothetical protein
MEVFNCKPLQETGNGKEWRRDNFKMNRSDKICEGVKCEDEDNCSLRNL